MREGGLIVVRQRPHSAKGFVFITIEEKDSLMNVIVRHDAYERYREVFRDSTLVAILGRVQRAFGTVNVLARRVVALDPKAPDAPQPGRSYREAPVSVPSHDFH